IRVRPEAFTALVSRPPSVEGGTDSPGAAHGDSPPAHDHPAGQTPSGPPLAPADAGLRPPASDAGLQVIEGAPARMPAGIEADLTPVEVAWLRSGRRPGLGTLTPRAGLPPSP